MAWHRSGDKPLSEPMMVSLPTHICVTRPQWVKSGTTKNTPGSQHIKRYFLEIKLVIFGLCKGLVSNRHQTIKQIWQTQVSLYQVFHFFTWWRHQIETFSALLALCVGNSPVTGEFPSQRPVTGSFGVFFCVWINDWVNNREAGDLRRHHAHHDVTVMTWIAL